MHGAFVSSADGERQLDQLPGFVIQRAALVRYFAKLVVRLGQFGKAVANEIQYRALAVVPSGTSGFASTM
jgi:hypothetical protein